MPILNCSTDVTTQDDMMELRGFEDSPEKERAQRGARQQQQKQEQSLQRDKAKREAAEAAAKEAAAKKAEAHMQQQQEEENRQQQQPATAAADPGFNLDEILHMDSIPGLANILADDSLDFGHKGRDSIDKNIGLKVNPKTGPRC